MITVERNGRVAELVLGREPCNEIGPELVTGLESFVASFDPSDTRAVLIRSSTRLGFSAGADLRALHGAMVRRPKSEWVLEVRELLDRIHALFDAIDALPVPTVAVVHGVCFGGGLELALTCDVRIAERSARFAFPELRLGLVPGFGGIPRLERDVGHGMARDLFLTGRSINAKKALDIGLVSQMVGPGKGADVGRRLAARLCCADGDALAAGKAFVKPIPRERLAAEKRLFMQLIERPTVERALSEFCASTDALPYVV